MRHLLDTFPVDQEPDDGMRCWECDTQIVGAKVPCKRRAIVPGNGITTGSVTIPLAYSRHCVNHKDTCSGYAKHGLMSVTRYYTSDGYEVAQR